MKTIEISVSRSCRVNLGNYEGTEHFVSMKAVLDELDDEASAAEELTAHVNQALLTQLHLAYAVRGKTGMTFEKIAKHHGLYPKPRV